LRIAFTYLYLFRESIRLVRLAKAPLVIILTVIQDLQVSRENFSKILTF